MGGTELFNPIHHILNQDSCNDKKKFVFLLTDGAVDD